MSQTQTHSSLPGHGAAATPATATLSPGQRAGHGALPGVRDRSSPCPEERGELAGSPGAGLQRGAGSGLTLGMASSSRNLALLRRARRFCCCSCRGRRLQTGNEGGMGTGDAAGMSGTTGPLTCPCGSICSSPASSARRSCSRPRRGLSPAAPCWGGSGGRGSAGGRCISSFLSPSRTEIWAAEGREQPQAGWDGSVLHPHLCPSPGRDSPALVAVEGVEEVGAALRDGGARELRDRGGQGSVPAVLMQNPNRRGNPNSGFRLLPEVGEGGREGWKEPRPGQSYPGLALRPRGAAPSCPRVSESCECFSRLQLPLGDV